MIQADRVRQAAFLHRDGGPGQAPVAHGDFAQLDGLHLLAEQVDGDARHAGVIERGLDISLHVAHRIGVGGRRRGGRLVIGIEVLERTGRGLAARRFREGIIGRLVEGRGVIGLIAEPADIEGQARGGRGRGPSAAGRGEFVFGFETGLKRVGARAAGTHGVRALTSRPGKHCPKRSCRPRRR